MKRITLFAGHYGSGKTNLSVNYALALKKEYDRVAIADLDIVNPYFRTVDAETVLSENGIRLIVSGFAESNVDLPSLPAEAYAVIDDKSLHAVIDVGGDDRGALALGRYAPGIIAEGDYEMLLVVNAYRPLSRTAAEMAEIMREIEESGGIRFTGIVNNSNLGEATAAQDIIDSVPVVEELSRMTGLPVVMTGVERRLMTEVANRVTNPFPVDLYVMQR